MTLFWQEMTLVEGTSAFSEWSESSAPVFTSFYLFTVANAEAFEAGREKATLLELGPYTFRYARCIEAQTMPQLTSTI